VTLIPTERVRPNSDTSATDGRIVVDGMKACWFWLHGILALIALVYAEHSAVLIFVGMTAITICAGHSVGMHRLLIHRSFETPKWLEYILVWLGTLVGMAGPFGMIRAHDMRDWHQRQTSCPPHPSHSADFWQDAWWQLCCRFDLDNPPRLEIEPEVADDPIYRWIERTWMLQQLPVAAVLFLCGGLPWVLWGISVRICVSLTGHWMVGHFAHRKGQQSWRVAGVPVQGYNLPRLGLLTFGENWHGNHHAFPHSAKLGVEKGQMDPGFWLIRAFAAVGLASNICLPDTKPPRDGLERV